MGHGLEGRVHRGMRSSRTSSWRAKCVRRGNPQTGRCKAPVVDVFARLRSPSLYRPAVARVIGPAVSRAKFGEPSAQCIALHRYMRAHAGEVGGAAVSFPPPADFVVPGCDDEIDEAALGMTDPLPPEPARHV